MTTNMLPHNYGGKMITQVSEDSVIGNRTIPKGYCNATLMCKANGKKLNDYLRLKRSKSYLEALSLNTGIPVTKLVIKLRGTPDKDPSLQGVWVHPDVVKDLIDWLSTPKSSQTEKGIKESLAKKLKGEIEVLTPIGAIDILTSREIIEVKRSKNWKSALGQALAYGYFYPSHKKRIHLFGTAHSVSVEHIEKICKQYHVAVTWETSSHKGGVV